jgi:hypothetical protein
VYCLPGFVGHQHISLFSRAQRQEPNIYIVSKSSQKSTFINLFKMSAESNRYKPTSQFTAKYISDQLAWEPIQQTKIKESNQDFKNCGRPPIPYAQLISQAIENAPSRKVTLSGIYQYVMTYYPYFKTAGSGWKVILINTRTLLDTISL